MDKSGAGRNAGPACASKGSEPFGVEFTNIV